MNNSATKIDWTKKIIQEFKFLFNRDELFKSWVSGEGRVSGGYYEEICVIYDDLLFESHFIKEATKFGFSKALIDSLNKANESLNKFDGSDLSPIDLLQNHEWEICMKDMHEAAILLESELDKVPDIPINETI
jgi:hypothetical protein